MTFPDRVAAVMRFAETKQRSNGRWFATVQGAEHVAWAEGDDALDALRALRGHVEEELERIVRAFRVIWQREVAR